MMGTRVWQNPEELKRDLDKYVQSFTIICKIGAQFNQGHTFNIEANSKFAEKDDSFHSKQYICNPGNEK